MNDEQLVQREKDRFIAEFIRLFSAPRLQRVGILNEILIKVNHKDAEALRSLIYGPR